MLGTEVDLLKNYPKPKRDLESRASTKTEEVRLIARQFGKDFFDGSREYGYGGFTYHPRFWELVVPSFQDFYKLSEKSKVLDVGCAKGFMMYDFSRLIPGIEIKGIDISEYAIDNSIEEMRTNVQCANATDLPFEDNSFDLVISINTIHNLEFKECSLALKEIERVSSSNSFITVDAYENEIEKKQMLDWNLTAKTILSTSEWKEFFKESGYSGDFYWFKP
jgi:SAM-dependent methyltransferase